MSAANVSKKWIGFEAEKLFEKDARARHPLRQRRGCRRLRRGAVRRGQGRDGPRHPDDARHRHRHRAHLRRRAHPQRRARPPRDRRARTTRRRPRSRRRSATTCQLEALGQAPAEVLLAPRGAALPAISSSSAAASRSTTRSSCRCSTCRPRSCRRSSATTRASSGRRPSPPERRAGGLTGGRRRRGATRRGGAVVSVSEAMGRLATPGSCLGCSRCDRGRPSNLGTTLRRSRHSPVYQEGLGEQGVRRPV